MVKKKKVKKGLLKKKEQIPSLKVGKFDPKKFGALLKARKEATARRITMREMN